MKEAVRATRNPPVLREAVQEGDNGTFFWREIHHDREKTGRRFTTRKAQKCWVGPREVGGRRRQCGQLVPCCSHGYLWWVCSSTRTERALGHPFRET